MRNNWLLPVLAIALLLVGSGYWGYQQFQERQQLETYLGNQYRESFYNLIERVENLTVELGKGVVSTGQQNLAVILSDIWNSAMAAQADLNQLPISNATLMEASQFLSQCGDYARALARQNLGERTITEAERDKLQSMRAQAAALSQDLLDLEGELNDGRLNWVKMVRRTRETIEESDDQLQSNNFKNLTEANEPAPVLIYDGPFSDHIDQKEPKGLTGEMITEEKAREIAIEFPDYAGNPNLVLKDIGNAQGIIPAYQYSVQPDGKEENHTTIDITKKGGHVVFYLNPRNVGEREINRVDALNKGLDFLTKRGFTNMVPTYSWIEDNVLTVSYAYKQEDVIIYPDLIKLKIAMDNGQVIGFEALGYLMSHQKRDLPQPQVTETEIRDLLGDRFDVESVRLALIPTPGLNELLTWEARVGYQEETYLLYYDVEEGEEKNILRVIDTPEGTFAD